jgi:hypothetical protein
MSLRLVSTTSSASVHHIGTGAVGRAQALLGDAPTMTLIGDAGFPDACCTARLVRFGAVWLGMVSDRAAFADRVRMGMVPRFLFGDASVVTVSGVAKTRVLGRIGSCSAEVQAALAPLVGPWGAGDAVVIEVAPEGLIVDVDDAIGIVPRT